MNAMYSLVLVLALVLIALVGVGGAHMETVFGVCIPVAAIITFLVGFAYRIFYWAKSPVPFRIPTTGGQQQSLEWIKQDKWDNPSTGPQTFVRMLLEVLTFRSLFRNTRARTDKEAGQVTYSTALDLWLFALIFHYSFLIIVIRHLRLFFEPIPAFVNLVASLDGIFQILSPSLYLTDLGLLVGVLFLLGRRFWDAKVRYISLVNDYFPLFLILAIALSGVYMRYIAKVDVIAIKQLTMNIVHLHWAVPKGVDVSLFVHLFLVSTLLVYIPFSKLMHMGGVFLSPTRNMPNDSRIRHHENPWNPEVAYHTYEAYEDDFREPMAEAGLPLDKPLADGPAEDA